MITQSNLYSKHLKRFECSYVLSKLEHCRTNRVQHKKYEKQGAHSNDYEVCWLLVHDKQIQPFLFSYMFQIIQLQETAFILLYSLSRDLVYLLATQWDDDTELYHSCSHAGGTEIFTLTWVEVFTAFLIKTAVFWNMMPHWLITTNISEELAACIFQVSPRRVSCMESMVALYTKRVG